MPKMLSRFYDRAPNEHRVGAIIHDHCNGFRNVYRNPSPSGHRDIFLESLPVFRIVSRAITQTSSPRIRDRISWRGSRIYFRYGTDATDKTERSRSRSDKIEKRRMHAMQLARRLHVEISSSFSAIYALNAERR